MLTELSLCNFKSVKKIDKLAIKPLTIFTGCNGSGKSSILESMAVFAEAAREKKAQRDEHSDVTLTRIFSQMPWRYPFGDLQNYVVHQRNEKSLVSIKVEVRLDQGEVTEFLECTKSLQAVFRNLVKNDLNSLSYEIKFRTGDGFFSQLIEINHTPALLVTKDRNGVRRRSPIEGSEMHISASGLNGVHPDALFNKKLFGLDSLALMESDALYEYVLKTLQDHFERFYFISGERGRIDAQLGVNSYNERIPRKNGYEPLSPSWVGYKGENVIEVLSRCFTRDQKVAHKIQEWAERFQIPNLRAGYVGEGKLETNFVDPQYDTSLNAALAGLGSRQILPIIVQIFAAEPNSTIMIEEPEISLHPESQVLLDELFACAISEGKQIICTTHSPFLILAINRLINKRLLNIDDVIIYHVEKDSTGTTPKKLDVRKNGFLEDGVPSFSKVEQELLKDWSAAIEED